MTVSKSLPVTGFGLLGMTWRPNVTPDDQAFAAMKAAIMNGATVWSSSSVYGMPPEPPTAGLWLLRRYFERYPEDSSKVTLFIRACWKPETQTPTTTREGVRDSAEECNRILGGFKKIDIFGPARMDRNVPVEETLEAFKELVEEGQIGAVGLSECSRGRILSMEYRYPHQWRGCYMQGVGIPILTYAPLGYGFLTGQVTKLEDIPKCDIRHMFGRFQPENFPKNLELVDKVKAFAKVRDVTPAQLALAWIRVHSNRGNCGTIIPIPGATAAQRVEENCKVVGLSAEVKEELDSILRSFDVVGERQIVGLSSELWG